MAIPFGNSIDLRGNEIQNVAIQSVNGLPTPTSGNARRVLYNTQDDRVYVSTGSAWVLVATNSDALGGQNSAFHLARGNHTGTQTAATISDLASTVKAYRLDEFAVPTADLSLNGHKLTGGAAATADTDFPTYRQVLDLVQGLDFKASVRAATTANITLSGTQTIDGVSVAAGERVLVKNQSSGSQNGIYVAASGAWTRATDADSSNDVTPGMIVPVEEGTTNADTIWWLTTNGPITLNTTSLTFSIFGQGTSYIAGAGLTLTGSTFDVGAGTGISVAADSVAVDTAVVARHVSFNCTNAAASQNFTHSLGTQDVAVTVREVSTGDEVHFFNTTGGSTSQVTVDFGTTPTTAQYRVTVIG